MQKIGNDHEFPTDSILRRSSRFDDLGAWPREKAQEYPRNHQYLDEPTAHLGDPIGQPSPGIISLE
jgi:hypothetical protein